MKFRGLKFDNGLIGNYEVKKWSHLRNLVVDLMWMSKKQNIVHGFGEIDVTIPYRIIKDLNKNSSNKISFTGYLIFCLAQAIKEHKYVNAIRKRNKLYIFEDVDISTIIEKQIGETKFPTNYIIRKANEKSLEEISNEIYIEKYKENFKDKRSEQIEWFSKLPAFLRHIYWRKLIKNPLFHKQTSGTIGVTAVGMFVNGIGWAIPLTPKTLTLTVGGIGRRAVQGPNNELLWNDFLSLTFSINHDIIDGGPAARFINYFGNLLSSGFGLVNRK